MFIQRMNVKQERGSYTIQERCQILTTEIKGKQKGRKNIKTALDFYWKVIMGNFNESDHSIGK